MYTILAPAKINLALDVISKRADGYHEIDSVMQSIALADQLSFEDSRGIELTSNNQNIPTDENNLVWKAAKLLQNKTGVSRGVKIHLTKNVPVSAGLGGGSSDAAAALIALNAIWELGLSRQQLIELAVEIGADVPFCVHQGTARARGIGEKLNKINHNLQCNLLLVTPNVSISTALIYKKLDFADEVKHPEVDKVVKSLETGDIQLLTANLGNVLEEIVLQEFPIIADVKRYFASYGLSANLMSGSGSSVFALNPPQDVVEPFLSGIPEGWFGCFTHFQNK